MFIPLNILPNVPSPIFVNILYFLSTIRLITRVLSVSPLSLNLSGCGETTIHGKQLTEVYLSELQIVQDGSAEMGAAGMGAAGMGAAAFGGSSTP